MKGNYKFIYFLLIFVLIAAQFPWMPSVTAADPDTSVRVTKTVNPTEIFEGEETSVTLDIQGSPDVNVVKPNDIILIIDRSGSMAPTYGPNNKEDKMKNAKDAAKGFIDLVDFTKHRVGIVDFATNTSYKDLSTNPTDLKNYVDKIKAEGSTATRDAIAKAQDLLRNHRPDAQPVIVLMTDGEATEPSPNDHARQVALEQANNAKNEGVIFYTIALLQPNEDPEKSAPNQLMKEMATTAQHHHFVLGSVGLAEIYAAIVQEIGLSSAYNVTVTDTVAPEFEIVPDSYKDNIPQPTVVGNTLTWKFLELKKEKLTFNYKIKHKVGAATGDLPVGDQGIAVQYSDYLGVQHQFTVEQPVIKVKNYAPVITSVVKDNGAVQGGEQVVISGEHFRPNPTVTFGDIPAASVEYVSAENLIVNTPPGTQGTVPVKVTNDDGQFATAEYRYYAFPTISAIDPASGPVEGGTKVVIKGNYFMNNPEVLFGSNAASVTKSSVDELQVVTPAGNTPGLVDITINNPDGTTVTATGSYNYIEGPQILSLDPNSGVRTGGEQVTLKGERFEDGAKVYFNSTLVKSAFVSNEEMTLTTPVWLRAESVDVRIENPNGQSFTLPQGYTYVNPNPTITSVTPSSGPMAGGTLVTVKGNYFESGLQVFWGGKELTVVTYINSGEIRLRTPAWTKPETVSLKIVNKDGKEVEINNAFEYLPPPDPTLDSISPTSGLVSGGTSVAILGTNFVPGTKVFFDTQEVPVVSFTATKIVVSAPVWDTAEKVDVSIETPNGFKLNLPDVFEYLPLPPPPTPKITNVSPSSGLVTGGNVVSINGSNFNKGLKLYLNDQELTGYTYVSSSLIKYKAPAWPVAESISIKIINPDNQSGQLDNGYTYIPLPGPKISAVTPNKGPVVGGTAVKVTGTNFQSGSKVFFNTLEVTTTFISSGEVRITTPEWTQEETVNVKIVNPDGQSDLLEGGYTFEVPPPPPAPEITGLTPDNGPQEGGTTVSIKGSNFTANPVVKFDETKVPATLISSSEIRVKTPAWSSATSVKVTVELADGQSISLDNGFTYNPPPEKPAPVVSSVTPDSVNLPGGGVLITVNGSNFLSGGKVYFNDNEVVSTYLSTTQFRVKTPAWGQAESVNVKVVNPDGKEGVLTGGFTYLTPPPPPPPTIKSISPDSALASTSSVIAINGSDFVKGATVAFNDTEISATFVSASQLKVATPVWAAPETVDIRVTNPDGQSAELAGGFTFREDPPPVISSLSPNSGLLSGGGLVTVSGSNFKSGAVVYFDQQEVTSTFVNSSQIRIKVPVWTKAGTVTVKLVNPDGQSSELADGYTYYAPAPKPAPTVTGVTPNSGALKGGYIVSIKGSNFQSGATVSINGAVVSVVTFVSSGEYKIKMPSSSEAGPVTITITNPDGQTGELINAFTYN